MDKMDVVRHFVREREAIRLKKAGGLAPPWTDDTILREWRFCNVRRLDDRVSRWLYHRWYLPNQTDPMLWFYASVARQINKIETLERLQPHLFPTFNPEEMLSELDEIAAGGDQIYGNAYMFTGTLAKGTTKRSATVNKIFKPLYNSRSKIIGTVRRGFCETLHKELMGYAGFSSFLSGQVVADLQWTQFRSAPDRHTWAAMGPGSQRGLNRITGRPLESSWSLDAFAMALINVRKGVMSDRKLAAQLQPMKLTLMDWQNVMCEVDKYLRASEDGKSLKRKYTAHPDPLPV